MALPPSPPGGGRESPCPLPSGGVSLQGALTSVDLGKKENFIFLCGGMRIFFVILGNFGKTGGIV